MEVMTILISIMTTMMMLKASLGHSLSYFVSYFNFWMFGTLEYAYGHYLNSMDFLMICGIIFNTLNDYYYFLNFIRHHRG